GRNSENVFENPSAARDRRRSSPDRTDGQETALSEDSAAWAVRFQGNAPKVAAVDIRNAVMLREAIVDKCVIGIEKIHDSAIFPDDAINEHLGFTLEGLPQIFIEVLSRRLNLCEFAKAEPLAREVGRQRLGLRIGQHAASLLLEDFGVLEPALQCEIE